MKNWSVAIFVFAVLLTGCKTEEQLASTAQSEQAKVEEGAKEEEKSEKTCRPARLGSRISKGCSR